MSVCEKSETLQTENSVGIILRSIFTGLFLSVLIGLADNAAGIAYGD